MKHFLIFFSFIFFSTLSLADTGKIRGVVVDKVSGETLIGAYVIVDDSGNGTTTDLDGQYTLELSAGTYKLSFTSIGYVNQVITDVVVQSGQVTVLNVNMSEESIGLDEVVVTAKASQRSEGALMAIQKKSLNLMDAISSETFSRSGDGNAAEAVKRVPGVSIEGGKYVFVRGLGDRYIKTVLNGMTIPGLDPDKNTVQMDLFPTNLIDNLIVYKTFTPDLPGDFTGGLVDITLKDFPETKTMNFSMGLGATPGMNFNPNFVLYEKGKMDWAGFAGDRKLQFNPNSIIPDETAGDNSLSILTHKFSKELGVKKGAANFANQSYAFSFGNQYDVKNVSFGLNFAANYSNSYKFYDDVYRGVFFKDTENKSTNILDKREVSTGTISQNEVLWSALIGGAIKTEHNKYTISLVHSQNGDGRAAEYFSQNFDETKAKLYKNAIEYSQKSVTNALLAGKHDFGAFQIDWKVSPTYSHILEPDVRSTKLSFNDELGTYDLKLGDGAGIDRFFRTLNEVNVASKIDITYHFLQWNGLSSKLKFGLSNTYKDRDYSILLYKFNATSDFNDFSKNFNEILTDDNIWNPTSRSGMYVVGNRDLNNEYKANSNVAAAYIMNELPITDQFKTVYGLRVEKSNINYQGYYNNIALDSLVHDELDVLPSVGLIYNVIENMNLRGSFTKTLARPSFKEKSNAHIDDPISQTVFIGNIDLKETMVNNFDLRWEYFFKNKEIISLSGFYKQFHNPIELVPFELSPNNIQPRNINESEVFGLELELKKKLTSNSARFKVGVVGNVTLISSKVNIKDVKVDVNGKTEYDLRVENARNGEVVKDWRQMQGQAPYIVNLATNMAYQNHDLNVSYNVQGAKLFLVGSGILPDVFENPFHGLNTKYTLTFGKENRSKLSFAVQNLLNDGFKQVYNSYQADTETYYGYSKGRSFSLGYSYKFF